MAVLDVTVWGYDPPTSSHGLGSLFVGDGDTFARVVVWGMPEKQHVSARFGQGGATPATLAFPVVRGGGLRYEACTLLLARHAEVMGKRPRVLAAPVGSELPGVNKEAAVLIQVSAATLDAVLVCPKCNR